MRSWPSVTTTSPAFRPRVTMTLSPTRRPVVTAIVSALPPERPLRPRTTVTLSPEAEVRSEEHTSELQSLMRNSYAVFCLKKQTSEKRIQYSRYSYDLQHTHKKKHN